MVQILNWIKMLRYIFVIIINIIKGDSERSFLVEHLKGTALYKLVCVLCKALRHAYLKDKFSSQGHGVCYACILFHGLHLTCCGINLGCKGIGDKLLLKSILECLQMPSSLPCRRGRAA